MTLNTRRRYFSAVRKLLPALETTQEDWDSFMVHWIEEQYSNGEGITGVGDALCGLHHFAPTCRGQLQRAWKLFRVWRRVEKPAQAPPIPLLCFLGLLGRCLEQENLALAVLFILGFWGMLRTGELLKLEFQHILVSDHTVVVQLGRTKTGLRRAIDENVVLYDDISKMVISTFMNIHSTATRDAKIWPHTSTKFRDEFKRLLKFFAVERLFRPYSLLRGGATEDFSCTAPWNELC